MYKAKESCPGSCVLQVSDPQLPEEVLSYSLQGPMLLAWLISATRLPIST